MAVRWLLLRVQVSAACFAGRNTNLGLMLSLYYVIAHGSDSYKVKGFVENEENINEWLLTSLIFMQTLIAFVAHTLVLVFFFLQRIKFWSFCYSTIS